MQGKRYIIIGDGAAGVTAAQRLRELDPLSSITIVSDDPNPAYYRAALTNYLLGELTESQIWAVPPTFFYDYRVERLFGRVVGVDDARSAVWLEGAGQPLVYDALFVASGARARPPTFPGAELPGVATLRSLQDARAVLDLVQQGRVRRAIVIGGGPLAIEWAMALRERRVEVILMVRETRVLGRALDAEGSDLVLTRMKQAGIEVWTGDEVVGAFPGHDGRVAGAQTRLGQAIECQLVGAAIGVIPNTYFLGSSGVRLAARGGIAVDDRLATSVANIYAAGDVVELEGQVAQLWEPARRQAMVAAANMTGGNERYQPGVLYFATRLADLDFASVGNVDGGPGVEELVERSRERGRIAYRKVLLQGGRLVGALMLGQREERVRQRGRLFKRLIDAGVDVSSVRGALLDTGFDLSGWLKGRALLRDPEAPRSALGRPAAPGSAPAATPAEPSAAVARPPPAQLRGTQMVNLGGAAAAAAALQDLVVKPAAHVKVTGAQKGAGSMLTIGLPMAALDVTISDGSTPRAALEGAGGRWPIEKAVTSIGSDPGADVVLADVEVSYLHAQISQHAAALFLRDVGSATGTWVNGQRVTVPHRLCQGDELRLGQTTLRFVEQGRGA